MIGTEEEAKTKRCQESFSSAYVSPTGTTMMAHPGVYPAVVSSPIYCIASGCMAWRWVNDEDYGKVGYCGKAGVP